jgi:hypothetical protein
MTQEGTGFAAVDKIYATTDVPFNGGSNKLAKLYSVPNIDNATQSLTGTKYEPASDWEHSQFVNRQKIRLYDDSFVSVQLASRELLDNAFERISNATDSNLTQAERSNSFDEWKDVLRVCSRKVAHFSSNHRKVLGILLSMTKEKDICDFSVEALRLFVQATNVLRQPRVTKPESRQMVSRLLGVGVNTAIPLLSNTMDENITKELDDTMNRLIAEEIKMNG